MKSGHEACSCTACQASISGSEPAGSFYFIFLFYFYFSNFLLFSASVSVYILAGRRYHRHVCYLSVFTPKSIPGQIEILLF